MKAGTKAKTLALLSGVALFSTVATAWCQSPEEITVTGRYGLSDNVRSISQTVSYADLDLSTDGGRHELHHRISLTARYLCGRLGESETSATVAPTCRDDAVKNANMQADDIIAHARPRGPGWVAGPAWAAPYPTTWIEEYP